MLSAPLVLANYVHNSALQTKSNHVTGDNFDFHGGWQVDRYYNLTLSSASVNKMLTYSETSWFSYLDNGG